MSLIRITDIRCSRSSNSKSPGTDESKDIENTFGNNVFVFVIKCINPKSFYNYIDKSYISIRNLDFKKNVSATTRLLYHIIIDIYVYCTSPLILI